MSKTKKILCYAVEMGGSTCYFTNLKEALSSMEGDLHDLTGDDIGTIMETSMTISLVLMSQRKFNALPDFAGY